MEYAVVNLGRGLAKQEKMEPASVVIFALGIGSQISISMAILNVVSTVSAPRLLRTMLSTNSAG